MDRPSPGLANSLGNVGSARSMILSPAYPNLGLEDMMNLANSGRLMGNSNNSHNTNNNNNNNNNTNKDSNNIKNTYKSFLTSSKTWMTIGILGFLILVYVLYTKHGRSTPPKPSSSSSSIARVQSPPTRGHESPMLSPSNILSAHEETDPRNHQSPFGNETSALFSPLNTGYSQKMQEAIRAQQQPTLTSSHQIGGPGRGQISAPLGGPLPADQMPPTHGAPGAAPPPTQPSPYGPNARIANDLGMQFQRHAQSDGVPYDSDYFYREGMKDPDIKLNQQRLNTLETKVGELMRKIEKCSRTVRRLDRFSSHSFDEFNDDFLALERERSDRIEKSNSSRPLKRRPRNIGMNTAETLQPQQVSPSAPSAPSGPSKRQQSTTNSNLKRGRLPP